MKNVIAQHTVLPASRAPGSSTATELLVTAEANCWIVWLRSSRYPDGSGLVLKRSESDARSTAQWLAASKSDLGLHNLAGLAETIG